MSDARNRARHEVITYSHRIQAEHLVYSTAATCPPASTVSLT